MDDKKFQRTIKIALCAVLIIALCFAVIFYFQYKAALKDPRNQVTYQNSDQELGINPEVAKQLDDYRCMAFYGIDDDGVSGIIIVVAINWDTHECKLFKVQANTYMEMDAKKTFIIKGHERSKFACSYTYSKAGLVASMKMLNRHMDLTIREGIGVDLEAIRSIIDDLGGIEITMSQTMCDAINERYVHPGQIKLKNGKAKLNGQQAAEFLSTWNDSNLTSDVDEASAFDVFTAIIQKAKEKKEDNLLKILSFAFKGVDTNINLKDLAVLVREIGSYDIKGEFSWPYSSKSKIIDGYQLAVPTTLSSNVTKLHKELFGQKDYKPTKTCERLSTHNK